MVSSTESTPLRERLLPQTSIRFFLFLIGVSALVMYTYRAAFVGGQFWAKIASLVITIVGGCFVVYAAMFFLVNLFTATAAPIRHALESEPRGPEARGNTSSNSPSAASLSADREA